MTLTGATGHRDIMYASPLPASEHFTHHRLPLSDPLRSYVVTVKGATLSGIRGFMEDMLLLLQMTPEATTRAMEPPGSGSQGDGGAPSSAGVRARRSRQSTQGSVPELDHEPCDIAQLIKAADQGRPNVRQEQGSDTLTERRSAVVAGSWRQKRVIGASCFICASLSKQLLHIAPSLRPPPPFPRRYTQSCLLHGVDLGRRRAAAHCLTQRDAGTAEASPRGGAQLRARTVQALGPERRGPVSSPHCPSSPSSPEEYKMSFAPSHHRFV